MSSFDNREKAFEDLYAHDAELQFKVVARRNKLLGLWAANLLGITGDEAADYAKTVVAADFVEAGHEDVYRKVAADLGSRATEAQIRAAMAETLTEAERQYREDI